MIYPRIGYADWDGFEPVLKKAMNACEGVSVSVSHHFRQTSVMMKVGKGGQRSGMLSGGPLKSDPGPWDKDWNIYR